MRAEEEIREKLEEFLTNYLSCVEVKNYRKRIIMYTLKWALGDLSKLEV